MATPRGSSSRRSAFTLVELLTVIGIISLLISILVPSLVRARDVARKTATLGELDSLGKDLEMFNHDFGVYPESNSTRFDPIEALPGMAGSNVRLMGAHWLARALAGPDLQGMDTAGAVLKTKTQTDVDTTTGKPIIVSSGGTGITPAALRLAERKGAYLESANSKILVRDTDSKFAQDSGLGLAPKTGRLIVADTFGWPLLYYRANARAQMPFGNTGVSTSDALGIYNQNDNIGITGGADDPMAANWDFAGTGIAHGLGTFGPPQVQLVRFPPDNPETFANPATSKGKNFVNFLHEHRTHETGNLIKPVMPETFVLISPGKDGIFGTDDDVSNFNR